MPQPQQSTLRGLALLSLSALLFATMGVFIRLASHTVGNELVVFWRNLTGCLLLLPLVALKGPGFLRTDKPWMHLWRALVGLAAMYGFFYAIGHLPLSSAMIFTYSSPVFIPLVAWLFLKERITPIMVAAAGLGLVGVLLVCKPTTGLLNPIALIGIGSSLLASMAFVTVRALTATEPATRIVLFFNLVSTAISAIPLLWAGRWLTGREYVYVIAAGILATLSQVVMSKAYSYAPAGRIGPATYLAIIIAGIYAWVLWGEVPDTAALGGATLIFVATLMCLSRDKAAPEAA
jgi:drug/metabolite transporter (DMT)-like permease